MFTPQIMSTTKIILAKGVFKGERGKNPPTGNFCKNLYHFYIFILLDYFQIKDKGRKKKARA